MLYLMNSAMMPTPGLTYRLRRISRDEFAIILRKAIAHGGNVFSAIGYEATAAHIGRVTGFTPQVSRAEVQVKPGDTMLICKLSYRATDPRAKSDPRAQGAMSDSDFEYMLCEVTK